MVKRLVKVKPDNTVEIVIPAPNAVKELGLSSIDELLDYIEAREIAAGENVVARIEENEMPRADGTEVQDWDLVDGVPTMVAPENNMRYFRNQWRWSGSTIVEDANEVGNKRKENARRVRNKMLEDSDIDMRVLEERGQGNGAQGQAMKQYREDLRNLGTDIDADPENVVWPVKP